MPRLTLDDYSPGAPLEVRKVPGGAVLIIMRIVGDPELPARVALVLRCEPGGTTRAAVSVTSTDGTASS